MPVTISFYSYFREIAGCARTVVDLPEGSSLGALVEQVAARYPEIGALRRSTLVAVGLDYQEPGYVLRAGDEVAFFPPVQGG